MTVREEFAGHQVRCPRCKGVALAPQPGAPGPAGELPRGPSTPSTPSNPRTDGNAARPRPAESPTLRGEEPIDYSRILAPPQQAGEMGRIGLYRVLRVLGRGGMGVVFLAEDVQLGRPVALKVLLPALSASAEGRARFLREARAAGALQHDHVVTVYQVGEDRGVPYLAMQLLEGESLEDRLRREPRLPLRTVLRLGREIADGLAAAHARYLIHRDIKPGNVWLEAGRDRVKILDFGLARAPGAGSKVTQPGAVVGTPAYMSPEQARGQVVGTRSDLFSLGCVLYHLCTGQVPFQGEDTLATLAALAVDDPTPVRALNPAVPPELSELIGRLLAKDPAARPASAREVVEALADVERALLTAVTAVSPPSGPRAPAALPVRTRDTALLTDEGAGARRRWLLAGAADVAALGVLLSGLYLLVQALTGGP